MHITVRRPNKNDVAQLHELFKIVVKDTFTREGFGDLLKEMDEIIQSKEDYLALDFNTNGKKRYFLVAEIESKIVGTIEYGLASQLLIESTNYEYENSIEIGTVFVLPSYQYLGIGSLLLKNLCEKLARDQVYEFCLDSGYKIAGSIWKKKLGPPSYVVKDYWGEDYDHLVWCNKITETGEIIKN
jgi:GNAT superfamily N-acetyltransferase